MAGSKSSRSSRTSKKQSASALPYLLPVLLAASSLAVLWFWKQGYLLYHGDASAHLNIARRIIDSRTPGYEQIGTVWLPLPHLLMLPFVRVDWLWQTGLAGAIPSGICFVFAGLLLYGAARRVWDSAAAGVTAALLFALNPNMLYMQSLAMTEAVFFLCAIVTLYATVRAAETEALWPALLAGLGLLGATMTRYEGWFLIPFVVAYFFFKRGWKGAMLVGIIASAGPVYWFAHNAILYGDWLDFYRGSGSAKAIQGDRPYPGRGNWDEAYWYFASAARLASGMMLLGVGGVGLVIALLKRRWWPVFFLALAPAFYILSLHGSSTPIFVPHLWPHSYYNIRYGMAILPLAAFCGAAIVGTMPPVTRKWTAAVVVIVAVLPWVLYPKADGWITWKESEVNSVARRQWTAGAAEYLRSNYEPGKGIVASFGDLTGIVRDAGIPLKEMVHEGNGLYFQSLLQRPDLFLWQEWIVTRKGDDVSKAMYLHAPKLLRYSRVRIVEVRNAAPVEIYRRVRQ